jgi:4-hydroxybenzoyl-CoA thioesterase
MSKPIEGRDRSEAGHAGEIRQEKPFRHSIRVRWGDCDPAKIAYTPNIPAWAIQAIEEWWKHHAGVDWYEINLDHHVGTPFVHMKMDFRSPVTPRHMLDCDVRLKRLGTRSITHEVKAYQNGVLCFEGEFVAVFVDAGHAKSRTPPADILAAIKKSVLEG